MYQRKKTGIIANSNSLNRVQLHEVCLKLVVSETSIVAKFSSFVGNTQNSSMVRKPSSLMSPIQQFYASFPARSREICSRKKHGMNGLQLSAILLQIDNFLENPDVETGQCC